MQNLSEAIAWIILSETILYIDYSSDFIDDLIYYLFIGFPIIIFSNKYFLL